MTGSASRRKGNRWEVDVCHVLEAYGWAAITSRNARGGTQQGVDIVTDFPLMVEAKNQKTIELARWLDQALEQADPDPPVVMIKRRGHRPEHGYALMRIDQLLELVRKVPL